MSTEPLFSPVLDYSTAKVSDLVNQLYTLSADLSANAPTLMQYENRFQLNWQNSGLPEPQSQTVIYITFAARPVDPSIITPVAAAEGGSP